MAYWVEVVAPTGAVRWLRHGQLQTERRKSTRYAYPLLAERAIESHARRNPKLNVSYTIVSHTGLRTEHDPRSANPSLSIHVQKLDNGALRVYSREASCSVVTTDLQKTLSDLVKDWAEQVLCDL